MGARRIGLIGVDFTDHHFFAQTGRHSLAREINQINNEYAALAETCRHMGVEVFNLGADSRITAFPKMSPEEFARRSPNRPQAAADLRGSKTFFVNYIAFSPAARCSPTDCDTRARISVWSRPPLGGMTRSFRTKSGTLIPICCSSFTDASTAGSRTNLPIATPPA